MRVKIYTITITEWGLNLEKLIWKMYIQLLLVLLQCSITPLVRAAHCAMPCFNYTMFGFWSAHFHSVNVKHLVINLQAWNERVTLHELHKNNNCFMKVKILNIFINGGLKQSVHAVVFLSDAKALGWMDILAPNIEILWWYQRIEEL